MDQWRSKFSESFSLDRYWSIECSSLQLYLWLAICNSDLRAVSPTFGPKIGQFHCHAHLKAGFKNRPSHCKSTISLRAFVCFYDGRVFIRSWCWDPPKLSREILSFSQNDFGKFLRGGYPNRSSGIHRWGLDLSTGYPNTYFSWFSGYPQLTCSFCRETKSFGYFPVVPVTKIRVSAPAPYKNPTVILRHPTMVNKLPRFCNAFAEIMSIPRELWPTFTNMRQPCLRSFDLSRLILFHRPWPISIDLFWPSYLFHRRAQWSGKSFCIQLGLFYLRLVFLVLFAYGGYSGWSFLLMAPTVRKIGFGFFCLQFPHRK